MGPAERERGQQEGSELSRNGLSKLEPEEEFRLDDPELVSAFQEQIEKEATRLEIALETSAWDLVAEIVHRLKSSTAYLGLSALTRTAAVALEALEKEEEPAELAVALFDGIREYLDTIES